MNLRELSRHLGVSPTTVSRALAGYSDVAEATRARVREAAQRLGYVPNAVARRLARGRPAAAGVVMPVAGDDFFDPFFSQLLAGLSEALHPLDLDLLVTAAAEGGDEMETYRRMVFSGRADAFIVSRTHTDDARVAFLQAHGVPFVLFGRTDCAGAYAYLDMDNEAAFAAATERLLVLGHHRIALLNAPHTLNFARERRLGYVHALNRAGLGVDPMLVLETRMNEAGGHACAEDLLARDNPPTAMLCANDAIALGVLRAIKSHGLVAGEDVAVIGYDDLPLARFTDPPLTTMRQPIRAAGRRLAEMLGALLAGAKPEELGEVWEAELVVRASDGPPRHDLAAERRAS